MSFRILIALLVPALALPTASMAQDPAIRLTVTGNQRNSEGGLQLLPGDPVRVQAQARNAGHLLVLNVEPGGGVRVIFPVDPFDDTSIRGGRQYEIRDAAARESFIASETGAGLVYAAVSPDPYRFDSVTRDGRWNVEALAVPRDADPEEGATNLVLAMTSDRGFDFDVLPYVVQNEVTEVVEVVEENHYYYDPYCYSCGRTGLFIGLGFGTPYYYSPYYSPYGYGYGFPRGGFFGGHITHTSRPYTQLTGRARGYGARQFGGDRFDDGRRRFGDGRGGFDDRRDGFDDGRSGFDGRSRGGGGRTVAARPAVESRPVTTSGPMERVARRARPSTVQRADGPRGRSRNSGAEVGRREPTRVTSDAAERGGGSRARSSTTIEGAAVTRPERVTARNASFAQSQAQDPPARARARPSRPERAKEPVLVRRKDRPSSRSEPQKARPSTERPAARPSSSDRPTANRTRPSSSAKPAPSRPAVKDGQPSTEAKGSNRSSGSRSRSRRP